MGFFKFLRPLDPQPFFSKNFFLSFPLSRRQPSTSLVPLSFFLFSSPIHCFLTAPTKNFARGLKNESNHSKGQTANHRLRELVSHLPIQGL